MTVDDVVARFSDAKRTAAGWEARCPAHDDRRASLSVTRGADGRVLLHCFAGCPFSAILAAVNLTASDLFALATSSAKPQIVATYVYRDEDGVHLYDVVRFAPKDFRQRRADGTWAMKGVRRVLYHLDELPRHSVAYLTEGEVDADELRALGLPGTTAPGGAGKWKPEYAE